MIDKKQLHTGLCKIEVSEKKYSWSSGEYHTQINTYSGVLLIKAQNGIVFCITDHHYHEVKIFFYSQIKKYTPNGDTPIDSAPNQNTDKINIVGDDWKAI